MQVKMYGLPNTKGLQAHKLTIAASGAPDRALMLEQLTDVNNFVKESLRLLGDESDVECLGEGAMERLCELQGNIKAARAALKGAGPHRLFPCHAVDCRVCYHCFLFYPLAPLAPRRWVIVWVLICATGV